MEICLILGSIFWIAIGEKFEKNIYRDFISENYLNFRQEKISTTYKIIISLEYLFSIVFNTNFSKKICLFSNSVTDLCCTKRISLYVLHCVATDILPAYASCIEWTTMFIYMCESHDETLENNQSEPIENRMKWIWVSRRFSKDELLEWMTLTRIFFFELLCSKLIFFRCIYGTGNK